MHFITPRSSSRTTAPPRRRSSRSAAPAATRAAPTSCRTSTSRARSTAQFSLGLGVNAPFGLVTRIRLRLARPLPGDQVATSRRSTSTPRSRGASTTSFAVGARRRLAAHRRRVHERGQLFGRARAGGAAGRGGRPDPARRSCRPSSASTPGLEARTRVKGDDSAWGWNIGALWEPRRQHARRRAVPFARSSMTSTGERELRQCPRCRRCRRRSRRSWRSSPRASTRVLADGGVTSNIELPAIANVSVFSKLNDRWDVMGDIQYTKWSTLKDLTFVRTTGAVLLEHAGELRRHVALLGRRELPLQRRVDVPRRPRVRPVAGQRHRPHAAPARLRSHLAVGRRAVQVQPQPEAATSA